MCQLDLKWFLSPRISRIFCQFVIKNSCWSQNLYCTKFYLILPSIFLPKGQSSCEERRKFKLFCWSTKRMKKNPRYDRQRKNSMMLKSHKWIDIDHSYGTFLKIILLVIRQWKYPGHKKNSLNLNISSINQATINYLQKGSLNHRQVEDWWMS